MIDFTFLFTALKLGICNSRRYARCLDCIAVHPVRFPVRHVPYKIADFPRNVCSLLRLASGCNGNLLVTLSAPSYINNNESHARSAINATLTLHTAHRCARSALCQRNMSYKQGYHAYGSEGTHESNKQERSFKALSSTPCGISD